MKALIAVFLIFVSALYANAQSFTYQGFLKDGGAPANGAFNLTFKLFDAASGGTQVGSTLTQNNVNVANGLFTAELNFGAGAFTSADRWLEVAVNGAPPQSSCQDYGNALFDLQPEHARYHRGREPQCRRRNQQPREQAVRRGQFQLFRQGRYRNHVTGCGPACDRQCAF
jgi:hypothetical protein